jgi:hypothetical protein
VIGRIWTQRQRARRCGVGQAVRTRVTGLDNASAHTTLFVESPALGRVAVTVSRDRVHLSAGDSRGSALVTSRTLRPAPFHDVEMVPVRGGVRVTVDDISLSYSARAPRASRAPLSASEGSQAGSRTPAPADPPAGAAPGPPLGPPLGPRLRRRAQRAPRRRRVLLISSAGVVCALLGLSTANASGRVPGAYGVGQERSVFRPSFSGCGLLTNERAYYDRHPDSRRASGDWDMTSGSLFARGGVAWTGRPDDRSPDAESARSTNSSVFRMVSKRDRFGDSALTLSTRFRRYVSSPGSPRHDYDGIHLWVRYRSERELYIVDVGRRDGQVTIKRKTPGGPSNGGRYTELGRAVHRMPSGRWLPVRVTTTNLAHRRVRITLHLDGRRILSVIDRNPGRLRAPGRIGIRGDNAEFEFQNLVVIPR